MTYLYVESKRIETNELTKQKRLTGLENEIMVLGGTG